MAQRTSRKAGKTQKRPELRTGGGRKAKAERSAKRQHAAERSTGGGPLIRMRPSGVGGVIVVQLMAWAGVALVLGAAAYFDRWNVLSYPDSVWLFVLIGMVSVAAAVGRVSRDRRDANLWGIESALVPTAVFVALSVLGPDCPTGGDCAAIGVTGWLGWFWSTVVLIVGALAAWGLSRWQLRSAMSKRPTSGRVRYGATVLTMVALFVFPGAVIAAGLIGLDMLTRDTPKLVVKAANEVERECYGLAAAPELAVRAAPNGYNPTWTTFAVRRANESRPGVGKQGLPSNWATHGTVHPYEATVSFTGDGQLVSVTCRLIGPGSGNATKDDLVSVPPDSNPLSPKTIGSQFLPRFFSQGAAGPTPEGTKLLEQKAKEAAAKKKAEASAAAAKDDNAPAIGKAGAALGDAPANE